MEELRINVAKYGGDLAAAAAAAIEDDHKSLSSHSSSHTISDPILSKILAEIETLEHSSDSVAKSNQNSMNLGQKFANHDQMEDSQKSSEPLSGPTKSFKSHWIRPTKDSAQTGRKTSTKSSSASIEDKQLKTLRETYERELELVKERKDHQIAELHRQLKSIRLSRTSDYPGKAGDSLASPTGNAECTTTGDSLSTIRLLEEEKQSLRHQLAQLNGQNAKYCEENESLRNEISNIAKQLQHMKQSSVNSADCDATGPRDLECEVKKLRTINRIKLTEVDELLKKNTDLTCENIELRESIAKKDYDNEIRFAKKEEEIGLLQYRVDELKEIKRIASSNKDNNQEHLDIRYKELENERDNLWLNNFRTIKETFQFINNSIFRHQDSTVSDELNSKINELKLEF